MNRSLLLVTILAMVWGQSLAGGRNGRILSMFQIVRFTNEPCESISGKNGTCFSPEECDSKDGTKDGSCASGYGVCCVFSNGCGSTSNTNQTYFEGSTSSAGSCSARICPSSKDICQIRLDFETFSIAGPVEDSSSSIPLFFGKYSPDGIVNGTLISQCMTDTFSVLNGASRSASASICGENAGQHMIVDVSQDCIDLAFQFQDASAGGSSSMVPDRVWSIKTTQYSCSSPNLAPSGCTQYFANPSGSGQVETFNYNGGQHLANQEQVFCVRREEKYCRICWYASSETDFVVSGKASEANGFNDGCCSYGTAGNSTFGADCLVIPRAMTKSNKNVVSTFCGRSKGLVTASNPTSPTSICSTITPFLIRFRSDRYEFDSETGNKGFRLSYFQDSTNC